MPATLEQRLDLETDPTTWRLALFENYLTDPAGRIVPDAPHHDDFWSWVWSITRGKRPRPFIAIWPRGGAKSTNAEMGAVALGARRARVYAWYISETQDQADDHVQNAAAMLEEQRVATFYPDLAERKVGKYGSAKGWRRNRLRTKAGFTIDALGLDTASRGIKVEDARPDLMILDDVDDTHDAPNTTRRKITTITKKLIPAGAEDLAVMAIQNLIHPDSFFTQMTDGRADYLTDRIMSGPIPALAGFTYETQPGGGTRILAGTPTWVGMDRDRCQGIINDAGITAFLSECQQEVEPPPGGMFDHIDMPSIRADLSEVPAQLVEVVCWVDPAVTSSDDADAQAIQIDGIDTAGTIWRLYSWEQRSTPLEAITQALKMAATLGASKVGIETDQGGETWESVYREAKRNLAADQSIPPELRDRAQRIRMGEAKAGQGQESKAHRLSQMLADYEIPGRRIRHVIGTHLTLERALRRFPRTKPFDLADAAYWGWHDLRERAVVVATKHEGGREKPDEERAIRDAYTARRRGRMWGS